MPPFWYVLFSFAAAIGIFLGIISFIFSFKRRANIYLSLLVFSWSAIIIQSILFWTGQLYIYPHFTRLYLYLQFLIAPIPFLYLRSLEPTEEAGGSDFKHFIPFLIVAFNFLPYYLQSDAGIIAWLKNQNDAQVIGVFKQTLNFIFPFYLFLLWNQLRKWKGYIDQLRWNWYAAFASIFTLYVSLYFVYKIFYSFDFFNDLWDYLIVTFLTLALLGLAILSHLFPYLLHDQKHKKIIFGHKYSTSSVTDDLAKEIAGKIKSHLIEDQLYRQNISIAQFAAILNISKNQLSQIVNQEFLCSFPELINQFRIDDAQRQIRSDTQKSIKEIYFDIGYSNKTTFYQHFKKITGVTPTEFRKECSSANYS